MLAPLSGTRAGSGAALAIAVGLVVLTVTVAEVAVRYVPQTWIQRDGRFYVNVNVTLVEEASIVQDEFAASWYGGELGWNRNLDAGWSNLALGRGGVHLPKHPVLLPILATPLFWAFGLHGTLIFNVVLFALIGGAGFALARRYGSAAAAALAALALLLGTGVRTHAYDYHVDVLMLALFTGGLALLHGRRGGWAGLLFGMAVVLRPTALLWLPSLALIAAVEADRRTLLRALVGGTVPLLLFAASNWWLYGAPWWTGYNRVLVVVNGEPQIADVSDAFSVPFGDGLRTLWEGPYGVRHRLTLMAAALPGLLVSVRRRPAYGVAALAGAAGSVLVFAKYQWFGDRFLWPSCALLVPALAVTFDSLGRLLRRRPAFRPAVVASIGCAALVAARAPFAAGLPDDPSAEAIQEILLHLVGVGVAAFGLTRATQRVISSPLAAAAPVAWVLLPGVAERALSAGPDLWVAATLCLALGARHWITALLLSGLTAWVVASAPILVPPADPLAHLSESPLRPVLVLLVVSALALPRMGRYAVLLAPLVLLEIDRVAALADRGWPLFALALPCIPLVVLAAELGGWAHRAFRDLTIRRRLALACGILLALLLAGAARRLDPEPFRIASYRGVRTADVHLGQVPCDFMAWEHLNWECSTFDRGVHGETGLSTSQPLRVGGRQLELFLISTQRGRPRTVRWTGVEAADTFALRYAVPDGLRGGGTLLVRVQGEELTSLSLPAAPDGRVHRRDLDTRRWAGREVALELELRGPNVHVAVDGAFEERAPAPSPTEQTEAPTQQP